MQVTVHPYQRYAKMRAHTATHLLHFALEQILGETKQAGSLVDEDYLRFDFSAKKPLTAIEIRIIEDVVNKWIKNSIDVQVEEMSYDQALQKGAKAFFEDKYGDRVRVVSIMLPNDDTQTKREPPNYTSLCYIFQSLKSVELCGGTHLSNTGDIGAFAIIAQESVASGIRRITAVTGTNVSEQTFVLKTHLSMLSELLDCQPKQLHEKLEKVIKDYDRVKSELESSQTQIIVSTLQNIVTTYTQQDQTSQRDKIINISNTSIAENNFKNITTQAKQLRAEKTRIIYNNTGNFALYTGNNPLSAKQFAKDNGLKGGGSDQLVQGKDEKIFSLV